MPRLELFYPIKPLRINQVFGIQNLTYMRFGFPKHNGIDYATEPKQIAYAMCDGYVYDTGFNDGAGFYVRMATREKVEAEGRTEIVAFMYMHAESILVKKGQEVRAGDPLIVCDNTGFSTGRHLHISAYFIGAGDMKLAVGDAKTDYCFDFSRYYNGYFAADAQKVFAILYQIKALLLKWLQSS